MMTLPTGARPSTVFSSALVVAFTITAFSVQAQTSAPTATTKPAPAAALPFDALFAQWDKDQDKALSLVEFKAGLNAVQAATALRSLHDNFVAKDADKDGNLGAADYASLDLIKRAGSSAPPMAKFDADKNQSLNFKEYVAMVNALISKP